MTDQKVIVIKTSDGVLLNVPENIACKSILIQQMLEDIPDSNEPIPLVDQHCTEKNISKILEFLIKHDKILKKECDEQNVEEYYKEFVKMEDQQIFDMIMATNYMDIKCLLEVLCKHIAEEIKKCKTTEDIRTRFGIVNDFTPEEEKQIREENCWYDDE